jgi:putative transcriptional regulator
MKARRFAFCALLLALCSGLAMAQSPEMGRLLVASPSLEDPNFSETVLLILYHDQDGSLAIAINRPTWVAPAEAFPDMAPLAEFAGPIYFGGPVAPTQVIVVFDSGGREPENSRRIIGNIYVTTDPAMIASLAENDDGSGRIRIFAGHAAWGPGQLEDEIDAEGWHLVDSSADQIFTADPATLWQRLPALTGGVTASLR